MGRNVLPGPHAERASAPSKSSCHDALAARLRTLVAGSDSRDTWCYVEGSDEPSAVRLSLTGWDGAGAGGAPCRAGSRWHRSCPVSRVAQGVALAGSGWTETWLRVRTTRPPWVVADHARQSQGRSHDHRYRHSSCQDRHLRGSRRRHAATRRRGAPAHPGAGRRPVAGRAAGDDSGARPVLGDRLRLARVRGEAERAAAVQDRDRRGGRPLHPREVAPPGRAAADHDARLARLGHRAARRDRPAHRPPCTRRKRRGRVRPRAAVPARLRLLQPADRDRLGRRAASRAPGRS